jgi:hypothetical protein
MIHNLFNTDNLKIGDPHGTPSTVIYIMDKATIHRIYRIFQVYFIV